jgi:SAM-dependent methyltransferase
MFSKQRLAAGTTTSVVVETCQVCASPDLQSVLFIGYLPPVNQMRRIGEKPCEQPAYPAEWLYCPKCQLVQLGLVVDPEILFPPEYPYTSGTTQILRTNFEEMYAEARNIISLSPGELVVDIGSNDGTLLANFKNGGHRVRGIEPSQVGNLANQREIPTYIRFFANDVATSVLEEDGRASVVTATNVFAHMENIHAVVDNILRLLDHDGIFISESHYLMSLIETLQYDTIYHEHLRYYSLTSLQYLLKMHGLEVIHAKRIPTHGGSIRVYAARAGVHSPLPSVAAILAQERYIGLDLCRLLEFQRRVVLSKLDLSSLLAGIRRRGERVYGIGAPSRASTLINYIGLDNGILECVLEVEGSLKIGKYVPGTLIPVVEEGRLYVDPPEYALMLSWHIAEELIPRLSQKGFRGEYIIPLPEPRIVTAATLATALAHA